ncbi:dihydropteroate synthase [bacterium]|nr:dihydropteroate synthase [bacterium]
MNNEIFIKYSSLMPEEELHKIGFDSLYLNSAALKYKTKKIKIFNLKSPEANILKQLCLSLGFDCGVSKGVVNCVVDYTNAILSPSEAQLNELIRKLKLQPYRLKQLAEEFEKVLTEKKEVIEIRGKIFDWSRPYIVAILNITPDSFSDGGKYFSMDSALKRAKELIEEGADIIDIGGESTKPGYIEVSDMDECIRILPIIEKLRSIYPEIVLSVDTRKPYVAEKALEAGADIINDIDLIDDEMVKVQKKFSCPIVVTANKDFKTGDIVENVYEYFNDTVSSLCAQGVERKNIILDVGIGFNKTVEDCFALIKRASEFNSLNLPMYWGISRKSFMQKTFGLNPKECDFPSLVYSDYLVQNGANFIRTHEVRDLKRSFEFLGRVL